MACYESTYFSTRHCDFHAKVTCVNKTKKMVNKPKIKKFLPAKFRVHTLYTPPDSSVRSDTCVAESSLRMSEEAADAQRRRQ